MGAGDGGGGKRYGGKGRGNREITFCCYTVTTRMTPALRCGVMRAILKFH